MEELGVNPLIIFDLDGTLIDSSSQIIQAVQLTRKNLQVENADYEFLYSKIGLPAKELFSDLNLNDFEAESLVSHFRNLLRELVLSRHDVFSEVPELLGFLKNKGIKIAIATNKPSNLANTALETTGLSQYIDYVVGGETLEPKPNPAIVLECLRVLKHKPENSLMVGDRREDMLAACAAGVKAFGLLQGVHNYSELISAGAQQVFTSISEYYSKLQGGWSHENL